MLLYPDFILCYLIREGSSDQPLCKSTNVFVFQDLNVHHRDHSASTSETGSFGEPCFNFSNAMLLWGWTFWILDRILDLIGSSDPSLRFLAAFLSLEKFWSCCCISFLWLFFKPNGGEDVGGRRVYFIIAQLLADFLLREMVSMEGYLYSGCFCCYFHSFLKNIWLKLIHIYVIQSITPNLSLFLCFLTVSVAVIGGTNYFLMAGCLRSSTDAPAIISKRFFYLPNLLMLLNNGACYLPEICSHSFTQTANSGKFEVNLPFFVSPLLVLRS